KATDDLMSNSQRFRSVFERYDRMLAVVNCIGKSFQFFQYGIILRYFGVGKVYLLFGAFGILEDHIEITRIFRRILHAYDFTFFLQKIDRYVGVFLKESAFSHVFE